MNTLDIIQSLCAKYQYMRKLMKQDSDLRRKQIIWSLKQQIWELKQMYRDLRGLRHSRGMLYSHEGKYFLADREITMYEYREYRKMQSLKVA
jgi:hypothetical protein